MPQAPTVIDLGRSHKRRYPALKDVPDYKVGEFLKRKHPEALAGFEDLVPTTAAGMAQIPGGAVEPPPTTRRQPPAVLPDTSQVRFVEGAPEIPNFAIGGPAASHPPPAVAMQPVEVPSQPSAPLPGGTVAPPPAPSVFGFLPKRMQNEMALAKGAGSGLSSMTLGAAGGFARLVGQEPPPARRDAMALMPGRYAAKAGMRLLGEGLTSADEAIQKLLSSPELEGNPLEKKELFKDPRWWARLGGQGIGSMVPFFLTGMTASAGIAGAAERGALSPRTLAMLEKWGAGLSTATLESLLNGGLAFNDAKGAGADDGTASQAAVENIGGTALTAGILNRFGVFAPKGGRGGAIGALIRFIKGSAAEGSEEYGQSIFEQKSERLYRPKAEGRSLGDIATSGESVVNFLGGAMVGGPAAVAFDSAAGEQEAPPQKPPTEDTGRDHRFPEVTEIQGERVPVSPEALIEELAASRPQPAAAPPVAQNLDRKIATKPPLPPASDSEQRAASAEKVAEKLPVEPVQTLSTEVLDKPPVAPTVKSTTEVAAPPAVETVPGPSRPVTAPALPPATPPVAGGGARDAEAQGQAFPRAGSTVDGRTVRSEIPNLGSIDATIPHAQELSGIREVPLSSFTLDDATPITDPYTLSLAGEIRESGEINPLIVGIDDKGPYIIEGGHRYDALKALGAKSFPAVVVLEEEGAEPSRPVAAPELPPAIAEEEEAASSPHDFSRAKAGFDDTATRARRARVDADMLDEQIARHRRAGSPRRLEKASALTARAMRARHRAESLTTKSEAAQHNLRGVMDAEDEEYRRKIEHILTPKKEAPALPPALAQAKEPPATMQAKDAARAAKEQVATKAKAATQAKARASQATERVKAEAAARAAARAAVRAEKSRPGAETSAPQRARRGTKLPPKEKTAFFSLPPLERRRVGQTSTDPKVLGQRISELRNDIDLQNRDASRFRRMNESLGVRDSARDASEKQAIAEIEREIAGVEARRSKILSGALPETTAPALRNKATSEQVAGKRNVETAAPGVSALVVSARDPGVYAAHIDGQNVANAHVAGDGRADYLTSISVEKPFRRQGIARAIYDFIEGDLGRKLRPSPTFQSEDAKAFWKSRAKGAPAPALQNLGTPEQVPTKRDVEESRPEVDDETLHPLPLEKESESAERAIRGSEEEGPPVSRPRRPNTTPAPGAGTRILIPGEQTSYRAYYEVRELDDAHPSHDGIAFSANPNYGIKNDRDYSDRRNQERVVKNATGLTETGSDRFNPKFLINDNPDAVNGPPVISEDGNALGGNSRLMVLQRVKSLNAPAAAAYRALLESRAKGLGVDASKIGGMKFPVLVRVVPDSEIVDVGKTVTDLNKTGTASLTASERAISDAKKVSPETLDLIAAKVDEVGPEATLSETLSSGRRGLEVLDRLVEEGIITAQEKPSMIDQDGGLTKEAKERIQGLVVGGLFEDPKSLDATARSVRQKLERIAAPLIDLRTRGEWDLTPTLRDALGLLAERRGEKEAAKRSGQSLKASRSQAGFGFGEQFKTDADFSDDAVALANLMDGPAGAIPPHVKQYVKDARFATNKGGGDLFGASISRDDAFRDAFSEEAVRKTTEKLKKERDEKRKARDKVKKEIDRGKNKPKRGDPRAGGAAADLVSLGITRLANKAAETYFGAKVKEGADIGVRVVKGTYRDWVKNEDWSKVMYQAHLDRYLADHHPDFKKVFKRAREGYEERNRKQNELLKLGDGYVDLSNKKRLALNPFIDAVANGKDPKIKDGDLDEAQKRGWRDLRKSLDRAWDHLEDFTVNMATDGEMDNGRGILKLGDAVKALTEAGYSGKQLRQRANHLMKELEELREARKKNYVPFSRFGKFAYGIVPAGDGRATDRGKSNAIRWEHRPTRAQAEIRLASLRKAYAEDIKSGKYEVVDPKRSRQSVAEDDVAVGVAGLWRLARIAEQFSEPDVAKLIKETISPALQKLSPAKSHLVHRKGTAGYEPDFLRSWAAYASGVSTHISRAKMLRDMIKLQADHIDAKKKPNLANYTTEWIGYLAHSDDKFTWVRSLMFHAEMGMLNLVSPFINSTQPIFMTVPWLMQDHTIGPITTEMTRAIMDIRRTIRTAAEGTKKAKRRGGKTARHKMTLGYIDYSLLPADVRDAALKSFDEGALSPQASVELGGLSRGGTKTSQIEAAKRISAFPFAAAEHHNRLWSFIAAYRLAKQSGHKNPFEYAEETALETQGEYAQYNRASWMRGPIGTPLAVFKTFTMLVHENYLTLFRRGFGIGAHKNLTAHQKKRAKRAFAAMTLPLFLASGVMGVPFVGMLGGLFNIIKEFFDGDPFDLDLWGHEIIGDKLSAGPEVAGAVMNGPLDYLTPWAFGARLDPGEIIPIEDISRGGLAEASPSSSKLKTVLSTVSDAAQGDTSRLVEGLAPASIRNLARLKRFKGGVRDRSGAPVDLGRPNNNLLEQVATMATPYKGGTRTKLSTLEVLGLAVGLQPSRLNRAWERKYGESIVAKQGYRAYEVAVKKIAALELAGDDEGAERERAKYNAKIAKLPPAYQRPIPDKALDKKLDWMEMDSDELKKRRTPKVMREALEDAEGWLPQ